MIENVIKMIEYEKENKNKYKYEEITPDQFEKYEKVRESGITNMFDINMVKELSGLSEETILCIMVNADYIYRKYKPSRVKSYGDKWTSEGILMF